VARNEQLNNSYMLGPENFAIEKFIIISHRSAFNMKGFIGQFKIA
jgi:hypothetical protein